LILHEWVEKYLRSLLKRYFVIFGVEFCLAFVPAKPDATQFVFDNP